jgi:cagE, trbE, virB component of type IV transporter system, conserved region
MYRLDRFLIKSEPLKYTLPWARIIPGSPTIVLNKDGSIQTTFNYRGPDLDSAIREQLSVITQKLNAAFMSLDTGWVMFFESQRIPSTDYPTDAYFPDPITKIMDDERKEFFSSGDSHFESEYYATLYWMPPNDHEGRLRSFVVEGKKQKGLTEDDYLVAFKTVVEAVYKAFFACQIPCEILSADEMVSYLYSTVSMHRRKLKLPKHPLLLDQFLCDSALSGGLEPRLGSKHMRIVTIIGYMDNTIFGIFDNLNLQNFSYRWISRYYCLGKLDSLDEVHKKTREWKAKFKGVMDMVREFASGQEDNSNINQTAVTKYQQAKTAEMWIESDITSYGYYTSCIVVLADSPDEADVRAKAVVQTINNIGFKAKVEDLNSVDAWMGTLPGNVGRNVRRHLVSCTNLIHMMPLSTIWAGASRNKHLDGPPLLYTQTSGNTPFRLSLHVGDVGHTLVVGPTGAGKSVFLNMVEASFRKYKDARVFVFDKGASSYVLTRGVGGTFFDLGNEESGALSFQPLAKIDDDKERQWALEWICDYVRQENLEITPERKQLIWDALEAVATSYVGENKRLRRMTNLVNAIQSEELKKALAPLCSGGPYGRIFDSDVDNLQLGSWQTFEMEKLMNTPQIVGTTLMYIFHRIEQSLKGEPTIIVLDECWVFFDNEQFAAKIREWLKVLRKANASVIFATQSITDIVNSPIFHTVLESCYSRIFLPNNDALEEKTKENYGLFGLNRRQIEIIASATKKLHYYYVSSYGSRLFQLALDACPVSLAYVAVNTEGVIAAKEIFRKYGSEGFNRRWLIRSNIIEDKSADPPEEIAAQ